MFYLINLHRVFPHRLAQFLIIPICFWFFNCYLQLPEERCTKLNFKQFSHSENSRSSLGMNPKSSGKYYLPLLFDVPSLFYQKKQWTHSLMTFFTILQILEVSIISLLICLSSTTEKSYSLYSFLWLLSFHTFICARSPFLLSSPILPHCF